MNVNAPSKPTSSTTSSVSREVRLGLPREADDDVGRDRAVRDVLADQRDAVEVALAAVGAAHPLEDPRGAGLQRQVDVLADRLAARRARGSRPRACAPGAGSCSGCARCPSIASTACSSSENLRGCGPQAGAVGVDVLAEQRHLARRRRRRAARPRRRAPRAAARPRGRASRARCSTSTSCCSRRRSAPSLDVARALAGQVAGEALELEEALGGQRVAGQELGQLVDLAGAEGDVDERELRGTPGP